MLKPLSIKRTKNCQDFIFNNTHIGIIKNQVTNNINFRLCQRFNIFNGLIHTYIIKNQVTMQETHKI